MNKTPRDGLDIPAIAPSPFRGRFGLPSLGA
jgi:hypothetical protein